MPFCLSLSVDLITHEIFNVNKKLSGKLTCIVFIWSDSGSIAEGSTARSDSPAPSATLPTQEETEKPPDPELEKRLLAYISDLSLSLPADSLAITNELKSVSHKAQNPFVLQEKSRKSVVSNLYIHTWILSNRLKHLSVTAASRVCCWSLLLKSSSKYGSPLLLLPLLSWCRWITQNYGPWSGLWPVANVPESKEKQKNRHPIKEPQASHPRFRALALPRTPPLWRLLPTHSW